MEIEVQSLTACEVAQDGSGISLGFVDNSGQSTTIRICTNQAGVLAMTLPSLIDRALRNRFGDKALRFTYPLASWSIEQTTDPRQIMVTFRTSDGFPSASRSRASSKANSARHWWPSRRQS